MSEHDHSQVDFPAMSNEHFGETGETDMAGGLGRLCAAAIDGCFPCQEQLAQEVARDALLTAHLVSMAWLSMVEMFRVMSGGVPAGDDLAALLSRRYGSALAAAWMAVSVENFPEALLLVRAAEVDARVGAVNEALDVMVAHWSLARGAVKVVQVRAEGG